MYTILSKLVKNFMPFAQERMGFKRPPRMFLKKDSKNAINPLGKTAYYNPDEETIVLYTINRHPKDIMRSLSHELVHHTQNCEGRLDNNRDMGEGYAQNDEHLREMEREAYEKGNLCFRDWEDKIKSENTTYFEHLNRKGDIIMSIKSWKNNELKGLVTEAWGFKMDLRKLDENFEAAAEAVEEVQEPVEECGEMEMDVDSEMEPMDMEHEEGGVQGLVTQAMDAIDALAAAAGGGVEMGDEMPMEDPTMMEKVEDTEEDPASPEEEEADTHWGADTEMTVGGTNYHLKKDGKNGDDERKRPMEEQKLRSIIKKAIKEVKRIQQTKKG